MRRGTFVSLTVGMVPSGAPHPPAVAARLKDLPDTVAKIIASGARIVPGTNAGITPNKPHGVYPHVLIQLAELGMPTRDVLRSATAEAAKAVGRAGRKSALRPCADADLLVLGSSPVDDISAVTDIHAVYRAGHRVR